MTSAATGDVPAVAGEPLVSVVIPCYCGADFLEQAVASCLACAPDLSLEVVIVNEGSTDATGSLADRLAAEHAVVRVVHHDHNRGVAEAFNTGFSEARGQFICRLAHDDVFLPGALQRMADALAKEPEVGLVYGNMAIVDELGTVLYERQVRPEATALATGNGIGICWMIRRAVWESGLRFRSAYNQVEDLDFLLRATREFAIRRISGPPLLKYRQHPAMATSNYVARMEFLTGELLARYGENAPATRAAISRCYCTASYVYRKERDWRAAVRSARLACRAQPLTWLPYRNLIASILRIP